MKKIIFALFMIIYSAGFFYNLCFAGDQPVTPGRLIIVGAVAGGIEVIYNLYKFITREKKKEIDFYSEEASSTNILKNEASEELKKYEILTALLSRSKMYDILEGKTEKTNESEQELNFLMQEIIRREPKQHAKGILTEQGVQTVRTQKKTVFLTNKSVLLNSASNNGNYEINPIEAQFEFYWQVTNRITGEVINKSTIDYYEVGKAYYAAGKAEKAKEYFLKTIGINYDTPHRNLTRINKAKAILFLERNYNMTLSEILRQSREYNK